MKVAKPSHKDRGNLGENIAGRYLESNNYFITDRNRIIGRFEIDIVAKDKSTGDIVFCEVKTSLNNFEGSVFAPENRVNREKFNRIRHGAKKILGETNSLNQPWRIDIISIIINNQTQKAKLKHFKNI